MCQWKTKGSDQASKLKTKLHGKKINVFLGQTLTSSEGVSVWADAIW